MNSIEKCFDTVSKILGNLPTNWVSLTTHRLDIYDEAQAKSQFLQQLTALQLSANIDEKALQQLPTAYDYIRLGHPLSCVLEWIVAEINQVPSDQVITFASTTMPILAVLRKNALSGEKTTIYYNTDSSPLIDLTRLEQIYGYKVVVQPVTDADQIAEHSEGTVIFVTQSDHKTPLSTNANVDISVNIHPHYGSCMVIHNGQISDIVKDVQHVRRRESIAMAPLNALYVLQQMTSGQQTPVEQCQPEKVNIAYDCIKENTGTTVTPLIASSGLSIQYAMMMGLVENAMNQHPGKPIKLIIPPNCYGGTNDQARRIADLIPAVMIVDLYVDGGQNLVSSLDVALKDAAERDGVPIILAEIPTNPRVEVPDMTKLGEVLTTQRTTPDGSLAVAPVFTVDQTFCPNVKLLHQESELAGVKTVSYSSGSKFPSGGRCIAGYCTTNHAARDIQAVIAKHLILTDNGATANQLNTLVENMPSMPQRITKAYHKTVGFVSHIHSVLPNAKINFIEEGLAERGFTPSVFSLDLPSTGATAQERETNKRMLNLKLIEHMIKRHPEDCKYCVSYGQLKGSYWTIPATSTQGTTKENDKDYIVRVALSPETDVAKLSLSFTEFCGDENLI
ncbi:MAG: cystathionine beta-lyase/cystathionine gamma-synthase [Phenylobacterium sp.]